MLPHFKARRGSQGHHGFGTGLNDQVVQGGGVQHPVDGERARGEQAPHQQGKHGGHGWPDDGHRIVCTDPSGSEQVGDLDRMVLQIRKSPRLNRPVDIAQMGGMNGGSLRLQATTIQQILRKVPAGDALLQRNVFNGLDIGQRSERGIVPANHLARQGERRRCLCSARTAAHGVSTRDRVRWARRTLA